MFQYKNVMSIRITCKLLIQWGQSPNGLGINPFLSDEYNLKGISMQHFMVFG